MKAEGVNLTYLNIFPAENFQRNLQFNEFDIAEMGLKFRNRKSPIAKAESLSRLPYIVLLLPFIF